MKPVFTAFFYENRKQFDIFVVEVKKPGVSEGYDLIKLGYMMRKMLVVLIKEKVKAPMVVGMIVNGMLLSSTKIKKYIDGFYTIVNRKMSFK